jgi:hypothetical protein
MADVKKINGYNVYDDTARTNIGCTSDTYNSSSLYAVGDVVVYNNVIYKCITAITKAEEWTAEHWQQICLRDLLIETRNEGKQADEKINEKIDQHIITGQEFATNEFIDGKQVYRKRINIGNLPNSDTKDVETGLSNVNPIKIEGMAYRSADNVFFPLPYVDTFSVGNNIAMNFQASLSKIRIVTGTDRTALTGYIDLYYTKIN